MPGWSQPWDVALSGLADRLVPMGGPSGGGGEGKGGVQRVKLENDGGLRRVSTLLF